MMVVVVVVMMMMMMMMMMKMPNISLLRGIRETCCKFVVSLCGAVKAVHRAVALEAAAELLQSASMIRHAPDLAHALLQVMRV
jgi:hypothetical protein